MRFAALDYPCPRCGAQAHRACRKLQRRGETDYLRVPHLERRTITNEGVNGNPIRRRAS